MFALFISVLDTFGCGLLALMGFRSFSQEAGFAQLPVMDRTQAMLGI